MSFLSNKRTLYATRIVQLVFAIGVLVLVCWSGTHRGWWQKIDGDIAIAVIASVLTLILTLTTIITHHLNNNPFNGSTTRTIIRLVVEVLLFLLWIATVGLMLRHKAGCDVQSDDKDIKPGELKGCYPFYPDRSKVWPVGDTPTTQWNAGVAFGLVECVSFIFSIVVVFFEDRSYKSSGVSYA